MDKQYLDNKFARIDERFEKMDQRFEKFDQRFDSMLVLFSGIDSRLVRIESRMDKVETKVDIFYKEFTDFKVQTDHSFEGLGDTLNIIMNSAVHKEELYPAEA